eukprot:CAMPEP_0119519466 /NCGR_PEP_ID=MMETSP1344-20130328/35765_1 /TAXON_ID=236787 /ORGANISM="Florenciella parvula, Strain CCMP2471" /LENGTH=50 /DNA_ID=CAMNT_0007557245 /DNA_START=434 /DNA_END=583 /DNA_ORIENTATION=-
MSCCEENSPGSFWSSTLRKPRVDDGEGEGEGEGEREGERAAPPPPPVAAA